MSNRQQCSINCMVLYKQILLKLPFGLSICFHQAETSQWTCWQIFGTSLYSQTRLHRDGHLDIRRNVKCKDPLIMCRVQYLVAHFAHTPISAYIAELSVYKTGQIEQWLAKCNQSGPRRKSPPPHIRQTHSVATDHWLASMVRHTPGALPKSKLVPTLIELG